MKLPYKGGGASKGNRPPAVGKGKRRKESSSGPKAKKIRLRAGSEDEFDSSLKDETHRPGFIPPPINRDEAQREQGELRYYIRVSYYTPWPGQVFVHMTI